MGRRLDDAGLEERGMDMNRREVATGVGYQQAHGGVHEVYNPKPSAVGRATLVNERLTAASEAALGDTGVIGTLFLS